MNDGADNPCIHYRNLSEQKTQSGLSIVATILALLIFSLFIAVAVSLVTTGANIGVQETQGQQAFDIAEGGIQYAAKTRNFPNYVVNPAVNLGVGSFTTAVPTLPFNVGAGDLAITVSSTSGFLQAAPPTDTDYWVMLCDSGGNPTPDLILSSTCEKISFTTINPTSFTGGTRGRHSSTAAPHLQNAVVLTYSWNPSITTTLHGNTSANTSKICVNSTAGFTIPGFIQIADTNPNENQTEDIFCSGTGTTTAACGASCTVPTACFTGCLRKAFDGDGNGIAHSDTTPLYQSEIGVITSSTGIISNPLAGNVQRVVQATFGPQ